MMQRNFTPTLAVAARRFTSESNPESDAKIDLGLPGGCRIQVGQFAGNLHRQTRKPRDDSVNTLERLDQLPIRSPRVRVPYLDGVGRGVLHALIVKVGVLLHRERAHRHARR